MSAAHPSIQPNISTSNLRGPLNFSNNNPEDIIVKSRQHQETAPSMKIQTEEDFNPPNEGL